MKDFNQDSLIKSIKELRKNMLRESRVPKKTELILHEDCVEITGEIGMVLSYETFDMLMKHPDIQGEVK